MPGGHGQDSAMRVAQTLLNQEPDDPGWLFRSPWMFLSPFADGETEAEKGYTDYWHVASVAEQGSWIVPTTLLCVI